MKKKRGQFYFIAILVIITLLIGIITIKNTTQRTNVGQINDIENELNTEISYVLDYLLSQDLTPSQTSDLLVNFSNNYINKIGENKETFFIIGTQNSIKIIGNKKNNTNVEYNTGEGFIEITQIGEFEQELTPSSSTIIFRLSQGDYSFKLKEGQNIYYLIRHEYDGEDYIING